MRPLPGLATSRPQSRWRQLIVGLADVSSASDTNNIGSAQGGTTSRSATNTLGVVHFVDLNADQSTGAKNIGVVSGSAGSTAWGGIAFSLKPVVSAKIKHSVEDVQ